MASFDDYRLKESDPIVAKLLYCHLYHVINFILLRQFLSTIKCLTARDDLTEYHVTESSREILK